MDFIRTNCPMAVLTEVTKTPDESELPSAAFFPSVTLRVYPNEIENRYRRKISFKIFD